MAAWKDRSGFSHPVRVTEVPAGFAYILSDLARLWFLREVCVYDESECQLKKKDSTCVSSPFFAGSAGKLI